MAFLLPRFAVSYNITQCLPRWLDSSFWVRTLQSIASTQQTYVFLWSIFDWQNVSTLILAIPLLVLWVCYLAFSSVISSTVRCWGLLSIIEIMSHLFQTLVCYWEPTPVRKDSGPLLGVSACNSESHSIIRTPVPCSNAKSVLGSSSWLSVRCLQSLLLFMSF